MINNKTGKNHHTSHQKPSINSKCKQSSSLKSRDSGLSPEPRYEKHFNESECVDYSTQAALSNDITDLKARLLKEENEKEQMKLQIEHLFEEKQITQKHLEAINQAYEMRITEMRCVIVELKNRLKNQQSCAIMEESEHEGSVSELSFQEGSVYNSEAETNSCNNNDAKVHESTSSPQRCFNKKQEKIPFIPAPENILQVQSLQEEILTLKSQIALLQSEIATRDQFYEKVSNPESNQNFECSSKYQEENKSNYIDISQCEKDNHNQILVFKARKNECVEEEEEEEEMKHLPVLRTNIHRNVSNNNHNVVVPIMKVAERVKLKQITEDKNVSQQCLPLDNDDAIEELSEHLKSRLTHLDNSSSSGGGGDPKIVNKELKQLYRRIEQLKFQNSILSLNLTENKQHCNYLYLLCGKYESNAIALQQALNCSDRAIEAYDVMLALLESKLAVLENVECAEENRNTAETVAHLLLSRLKKENSIYGKSSAPWQDGVVIQSEIENEPWTEEHDLMLRSQVSKLKGQRSLIQNTVVNLESPFCANAASTATSDFDDEKIISPCKFSQKSKNIEITILMQEVANLREEICELKLQAVAEQSMDGEDDGGEKKIAQEKK